MMTNVIGFIGMLGKTRSRSEWHLVKFLSMTKSFYFSPRLMTRFGQELGVTHQVYYLAPLT